MRVFQVVVNEDEYFMSQDHVTISQVQKKVKFIFFTVIINFLQTFMEIPIVLLIGANILILFSKTINATKNRGVI